MPERPIRPDGPPARPRRSTNVIIRFAGHAGLVALFIVAALLGTLSGVMFAYAGDLPQISALDRYAPSAITRVYARNGETLAEFAIERRLPVGYDDISPLLREAIISAEDKDFNQHFGVSVSALLARLGKDIARRRIMAGGSTLTMQLARGLFAQQIGFQLGDQSPERKIKEILVAIQIEKRYTKREIFTFYANQTHFGHGTSGVEAASRLYFSKHAKDLTLEEAAMLAGIIQTPARQSPFVNRTAATYRRNYVLEQMASNGYITREQMEAAKAKPIVTRGQPHHPGPATARLATVPSGGGPGRPVGGAHRRPVLSDRRVPDAGQSGRWGRQDAAAPVSARPGDRRSDLGGAVRHRRPDHPGRVGPPVRDLTGRRDHRRSGPGDRPDGLHRLAGPLQPPEFCTGIHA